MLCDEVFCDLQCAVLCCAVLCGAVQCCAVLCCAVLCLFVSSCAVFAPDKTVWPLCAAAYRLPRAILIAVVYEPSHLISKTSIAPTRDMLAASQGEHAFSASTTSGCLLAGALTILMLSVLVAKFEKRFFPASTDENVIPGLPTSMSAAAVAETKQKEKRLRGAVLTSLALALHNAPEGLAVGMTTLQSSPTQTFLVAGAISLHNIPEGVAVAAAMYRATIYLFPLVLTSRRVLVFEIPPSLYLWNTRLANI
jgi:hypothetical protein